MVVVEADYQKSRILLNDVNDRIILNNTVMTTIHNHLHCEIHIVSKGEAIFHIEGKEFVVAKNCAILIPPYCYHSVEAKVTPHERISFQADCAEGEVALKAIAGDFITEIFSKIKKNAEISAIYNHLFFILNELVSKSRFQLMPLNDYMLQIREFFSLHYNKSIQLSDLAKELHLSNMQTQRIVKKYTDKTFGENLLIQRMTVAENLMETSDMSLLEISEYVGYHSYCGFWKAYKKYQAYRNEAIKQQEFS